MVLGAQYISGPAATQRWPAGQLVAVQTGRHSLFTHTRFAPHWLLN
jgi:hypothetical protein